MLLFVDNRTDKNLLKGLQKTLLKAECINLSEYDEDDIPSIINSSINEYDGELLLNLCDLNSYRYNLIHFFSNKKDIFNINLIDIYSLASHSINNIEQNKYLNIYYGYLYTEYEGQLNYDYLTNLTDLIDLVNKFIKLYSQNKDLMLEKIKLLEFTIKYFEPNTTEQQPNIKIKSTYKNKKDSRIEDNNFNLHQKYYLFYDPDNYEYKFSFSSYYDNDLTNFYI